MIETVDRAPGDSEHSGPGRPRDAIARDFCATQ
jgi:hypothetical protein